MPDLAFDVGLLVLGVVVLYYGAEWLVRGSARLAASLRISPIVVGLTVVSLGTSAPELVVCAVAALRGNSDLAIGNIMGSNLANIGLILGLTAIVRPLEVHARIVWREMPLLILVTIALYPLMWDDALGRADGVLLLLALGGYLLFVLKSVDEEPPQILGEYADFVTASTGGSDAASPVRASDVMWVLVGSACLVLGGYCIVEAAVRVATSLGVSQIVIGLTVVAVGTSLPELATSLVAAARKEADIAVGNIVGSNIFNLAAILGVTSLLEPIDIASSVLTRELPAVLLLSVLLYPMLRTGWRIGRFEGALLLGSYVAAGIFLL